MWGQTFLLLFAISASGFQFPDEPIQTEGGTFRGDEEYPEYGDGVVDPADEDLGGLETRMFFGKKDWQNLGNTAKSFLHTLTRPDQAAQEPAQTSQSPNAGGGGGSHGFPVDASGWIDCSRVPRFRKRLCRKARRQERRQGRGQTAPTTPAPSRLPDHLAMQQAQQCCDQKTDLVAFNKCCRPHGFCPICQLDIPKLAQAECCPLQFEGSQQQEYRRCCSKYGQCPNCDGVAPPKPKGCRYKEKMFTPGSQMDRLPYKCMFVRCLDKGEGPETVLEYLDKVGCCEQGEDLFPPESATQVDECTRRVCKDGRWEEQPSDLAAVFASHCPEGWLDLGGVCVYIWKELMTRKNASEACGRLLGTLFLPQNKGQLSQLITTFNNMEGRDSSKELGGWVDAVDSGKQWEDSNGDTLTYQPWEEGSPDKRRGTACAGLTVTSRSQGWKDYFCNSRQHMLYPICAVEKQGCGSGGGSGGSCGSASTNSIISSNECETIRCNADSYAVREVDPTCCYHHEWNGNAFGPDRGWYPGVYPAGGFSPYTGLLCECKEGKSDCTQFLDYGDYGDEDYDDYP